MSDTSPLPASVRIGGAEYTVHEVRDLCSGKTDLNGWIKYNESEIHIEEGMGDQMKRATLWHEVVHGILEHAGHSDHSEEQVIALGYGIVQVLRDNPWLRGES